jgi:hypothetical protein
LNFKNQEEVMKRRAKLRSSRVNVYQKMVLGVGILSLILAVGVSPTMDPLLPAGVGGGTLLLFFLLKSPKPKREGPESIESAEPLLPVDKTDPEEEEILLREEDIVSPDSPAIVLEEKEAEEAQESLLDSGKKAVHDEAIRVQEPVLLGKEALKNQQEFSGNGTLLHIQERLVMLEEKTINLGEMLLQLEKKVGDLQKNPLKEEPKIDLQTILSDTGENPEKMVQ